MLGERSVPEKVIFIFIIEVWIDNILVMIKMVIKNIIKF